jgi:hypothetical protein
MTFQVLIVMNDMTMVLLPVAPHSLVNKTSIWVEPAPSRHSKLYEITLQELTDS